MTQVLDQNPALALRMLREPADTWPLVSMALVHLAVLLVWPNFWTIGLGLWWNANTVSHNFIHRPFFYQRRMNAGFSILLSLLLGLPQSVWRERHLAHHRGEPARLSWSLQLAAECLAIGGLWTGLFWMAPELLWFGLLPGLALGLSICAVHGHFEHADGTISHYGRIYNRLFFNDGYHVEHHASPGMDWRRLAEYSGTASEQCMVSRWPAVLRFLDYPLDWLEALVPDRPWLRRFVLSTHRRAWVQLSPELGAPRRIGVVGGGLFPRTALLLRELWPTASITLIDASASNLDSARRHLGSTVTYRCAWFDPGRHADYDLVVIPLAYRGEDRDALHRLPPAACVVFHDWIWQVPEAADTVTAVVSPWLLKRLTLVRA